MVRPDEDTEIETLTTPTPPVVNTRGMPRSSQDISHGSSTEIASDDENAIYMRDADAESESSYESSYDSISGEIACCFTIPKCKRPIAPGQGSISSGKYYAHVSLILTSMCLFVCASVLWLFVGYFMPACFCSDVYSHIGQLPLSAKLVIGSLIIYFSVLFYLSLNTCRSILTNSSRSVFAYTILLGLTIVGSIVANVFFIKKSGGWTAYIIYNDQFYQGAGAMFLKKEMFDAFGILSDVSKAQTLQEIVQTFVVKEGVMQLEAVERVLKWCILGGWFVFNIILIVHVYYLTHYRSYAGYSFEEDDADDVASVRSKRSSKSASRGAGASRPAPVRQPGSRTYKNTRIEMGDPPNYRDLSPPRSDYTSVTKRSAYSMRSRPRQVPGAGQSFAQNAFTSRSRNSLVQGYHYHNDTAPAVEYHRRPEYTNTGGRRNCRNITKTEDLLIP